MSSCHRRSWGAALGLVLVLSGPADADCPGPGITVKPVTVESGKSLTVEGSGLYDGVCQDELGGCRRPDQARPAAGLRLQLRVDGRYVDLGEFDADEDWSRTKVVRLPAGLAGDGVMRVLRPDGTAIADHALVIR